MDSRSNHKSAEHAHSFCRCVGWAKNLGILRTVPTNIEVFLCGL